MKEYALVIVSVIVFLVVFEGVLPKGKFSKYVKTVMSLVTVLVILIPIVNIFNNDYSYTSILSGDLAYEEYLEEYKKTTLEKEIKTVLESEKILVNSVFVEILDNKNKVTILLENQVLNEELEHIDIMEKAKKLVCERLYLTDWEIVVE